MTKVALMLAGFDGFIGNKLRILARHLVTGLMLGCAFGCKHTSSSAKVNLETQKPTYPARPTVAPPPIKIFHQDEDTYTLVTKADATDDEIEAILWQFHDAAKAHSFDTLKLSQAFVDARKPIVWFHVYRGDKCANEKFVTGKYPCGASYHGAGDYTLGSYRNPQYDDAVLHRADATEIHLWDADAPSTATH